ncbi:MAG: hypothetical protein OXR72_21090 [Gemmatimonadota bacterium]|nr:hypothetical protein [Gemmatimonadota bacterium]
MVRIAEVARVAVHFRGKRGWLEHEDESLPAYCEIRDFEVEDPFYAYSANHPRRRPDRDPIPIGPVMRHGSREQELRVEAGRLDIRVNDIRKQRPLVVGSYLPLCQRFDR